MNRRIFALILLGLLAMGSLAGCARIIPNPASAVETLETVTVRRGLIVATVNAAGNLEPESQVVLSFKGAGRVQEVLVKEGDPVIAGHALARLETGELELQVAQAEASLAVAEAQLAKVKAGPGAEEVAAAEAALGVAQAGVQTAEGVVASARANLARVKAGPTQEDIAIAQRRVEQAKNALWGAQTNRDSICGRVGLKQPELGITQSAVQRSDCENAQAAVQRSEEEVRIAELQLQQIQRGARQEDIAVAQAQLQQALGQLATAKAQVRQAEANLARARKGPLAEDIAAAQAQVDQVRAGLDLARLRLDDATLKAPFDGTVTAVNAEAGQLAAAGAPVVTLAKLEPLHVSLTIDETDIARLRLGQPATITLDAFLGEGLRGTVTEIAPTAAVQQGVVTYDVRVDLASSELPVRPGMTANVNIEVARKEDALLVPNRAIRFRDKQRVVDVLRDSRPVEVPITVGLSNEQETEILSGLSEGDQVVTSVAPANNPLQGGFFGGSRSESER